MFFNLFSLVKQYIYVIFIIKTKVCYSATLKFCTTFIISEIFKKYLISLHTRHVAIEEEKKKTLEEKCLFCIKRKRIVCHLFQKLQKRETGELKIKLTEKRNILFKRTFYLSSGKKKKKKNCNRMFKHIIFSPQ